MNESIKAHLALISVAFIYGLNYTIAKDVMVKDYITPFGFIMLRAIAGLILFTLFHAFFVREKMEKKDIAYAAMCSIFGVALNMLAFFEGLKYTSPIHGSQKKIQKQNAHEKQFADSLKRIITRQLVSLPFIFVLFCSVLFCSVLFLFVIFLCFIFISSAINITPRSLCGTLSSTFPTFQSMYDTAA